MSEVNRRRRTRRISLAALVGLQMVAVGRLAALPAAGHNDVGRGWTGRLHVPALTIPPGTDIPVTIDENVALKRDQIGNTFSAHVTRDVLVDGTLAIPGGTPAEVALVASEGTQGAASFRLVRMSIAGEMGPVRTDVARADATRSGLGTGKKTGIGAIAGGVLGLVTGGGLLKGAIVGAGGGLAWGLLDHRTGRVEQGTRLLFSLRNPVQVR
jgi:hypothetical protein